MGPGWLVIENRSSSRRVSLSGDSLTVGRDPGNDVVLEEAFVSRHHARLDWRDGLPVLTDAGSTYGLFSGDQRVREVVLAPGVTGQIRGARPDDLLQFRYEAEAPAVMPLTPETDRHTLTGPPTGVLRLPAADQRLRIGRDAGNEVVLDHPQVSRLHAICELSGGSAVLLDQSANGTFVNGQRISGRQPLRVGDRIRIAAYELEFDGQHLIQYDQARRARLDALHLSRVLPGGLSILHDVTLSALPTELFAVVGASGTGKSTLLDALCGIRPATSGTVLVNGRDYYREFASLRLFMGYVPQSDVVHRELSPLRALGYAAQLRLPADTAEAERAARVQTVLDEVGLGDRRDVPIGKLSGGQVKRVSIGVELLTRPSLFFLDEPTSGLDPGYEKRVMELLRGLATQGRTIVLVTHATQNIELCDHVAFMAAGGHLAYFGPPRTALTYFDCTDYPGIYLRLQHDDDGAKLAARFQQHDACRQYVHARVPVSVAAEVAGYVPVALTQPAPSPLPLWRQFAVLVHRYLETISLDQRNLALLLLQAPIIGIMAALIAKPDTFISLPDANGATNLLVILSCSMIWLGAMNAAREIVKELPVYRRERMVGLGLVPYLASKYLVLGALCLVQAAVLLGVVGLRARLPAQGVWLPGPIEFYATLVLSAVAGLAFGLAISTLFSNADRAGALVPYLLIPQIIFVIAGLGGAAQVLSWLTISHWSVQALASSADLARFAAVAVGPNQPDYPHNLNFLLVRWLVMATMTAIGALASLLLLKRHDGHLL